MSTMFPHSFLLFSFHTTILCLAVRIAIGLREGGAFLRLAEWAEPGVRNVFLLLIASVGVASASAAPVGDLALFALAAIDVGLLVGALGFAKRTKFFSNLVVPFIGAELCVFFLSAFYAEWLFYFHPVALAFFVVASTRSKPIG